MPDTRMSMGAGTASASSSARRSSIFNIIEDPGPPPPPAFSRPETPRFPRFATATASGSTSHFQHQHPGSSSHGQHPSSSSHGQHGPSSHTHPQHPGSGPHTPHPGSRTNPIFVPSGPPSPAPHPVLQPFHPDDLPPNPFNSPRRRAKKTAEKRALHNEIERRRRCNLNESVLTLGRLIPTLSNIHRPSQNQILTTTLAYVQQQQRDQEIVARELRQLKEEADSLRLEVNQWRSRSGMAPVEEMVRSLDFQRLIGELELERPHLIIPGEDRSYETDSESSSPETDYRRSGGSHRS